MVGSVTCGVVIVGKRTYVRLVQGMLPDIIKSVEANLSIDLCLLLREYIVGIVVFVEKIRTPAFFTSS